MDDSKKEIKKLENRLKTAYCIVAVLVFLLIYAWFPSKEDKTAQYNNGYEKGYDIGWSDGYDSGYDDACDAE